MQSRVDRQIRALALAQQCAAHGARVRTISRITGMNPRDLLRLLFPERQSVPARTRARLTRVVPRGQSAVPRGGVHRHVDLSPPAHR
jgi:hypothetical protein